MLSYKKNWGVSNFFVTLFIVSGVIAEDLLAIIKILVSKKYFTEADYNLALSKQNFGHYDKPEKISIKATKMKGKALSILSHIRYFGLIINRVPCLDEKVLSEDSFKLAITLSRLTEKLMAPIIRHFEVLNLEEETVSYLDARAVIHDKYPNLMNRPKPKHHFGSHYAEAVQKYGPCLGVWTARYESKNRVAKSLAVSGKNFINISKTVAVRQQFRQASVYFRGFFAREKKVLPQKVKHKSDILEEVSPVESAVKPFMDNDSLLCGEVSICQQNYKTNDVVVLAVESSDSIVVGLVMAVLYKDDECFFVVHKYQALRNDSFCYFETVDFDENLYFIRSNCLVDYKPLVMIGVAQKFKFALHHHLSVNCSDL